MARPARSRTPNLVRWVAVGAALVGAGFGRPSAEVVGTDPCEMPWRPCGKAGVGDQLPVMCHAVTQAGGRADTADIPMFRPRNRGGSGPMVPLASILPSQSIFSCFDFSWPPSLLPYIHFRAGRAILAFDTRTTAERPANRRLRGLRAVSS